MTHLKRHSVEKPNKYYLCNYAFSHAGDLRRHLETKLEKKMPTNAISVTIQLPGEIN